MIKQILPSVLNRFRLMQEQTTHQLIGITHALQSGRLSHQLIGVTHADLFITSVCTDCVSNHTYNLPTRIKRVRI